MKQRHIIRRMSGSLLAILLASTLILLPYGGAFSHANMKAYAVEGTPMTALELEQAIEAAQEAYNEAQEDAEEAATKVAEHEERIKKIETELIPAQQERTGAATREMYKFQQNGFNIINVLLGSESLGDFINQFEYITRVTDKHHAEIVRLNDLKQELEDSRTELRQAQEEANKRVTETYEALDAAKEAQAEAMRRIEEEARIEAALAASGGHLVEGERTNDIPSASSAATPAPSQQPETPAQDTNQPSSQPETPAQSTAQPSSQPETTAQDTTQPSSNNDNQPETQTPEFTAPPESYDSLDGWAARIDAYLAGSPLAGQGYTFASAALANGVDPRFSPAIACTESGKGRICFLPYNAWGWGSVSWSSWEEAINAHVRGLASLYGYTVTPAGARMYCPPNWEHWYNMVSSQMALI